MPQVSPNETNIKWNSAITILWILSMKATTPLDTTPRHTVCNTQHNMHVCTSNRGHLHHTTQQQHRDTQSLTNKRKATAAWLPLPVHPILHPKQHGDDDAEEERSTGQNYNPPSPCRPRIGVTAATMGGGAMAGFVGPPGPWGVPGPGIDDISFHRCKRFTALKKCTPVSHSPPLPQAVASQQYAEGINRGGGGGGAVPAGPGGTESTPQRG